MLWPFEHLHTSETIIEKNYSLVPFSRLGFSFIYLDTVFSTHLHIVITIITYICVMTIKLKKIVFMYDRIQL